MVCRVSIPNNKTSIFQHDKSQRHIDNSTRVVKQGKLSKATNSLPHIGGVRDDDNDEPKHKGKNLAFASQIF